MGEHQAGNEITPAVAAGEPDHLGRGAVEGGEFLEVCILREQCKAVFAGIVKERAVIGRLKPEQPDLR